MYVLPSAVNCNIKCMSLIELTLIKHYTIIVKYNDNIKKKTFYSLGIDPVVPVESPTMSSSAIIGIVIAAILLVLLVLDITCYCINRIGLIALCCNSKSKQSDEEDPKLGR